MNTETIMIIIAGIAGFCVVLVLTSYTYFLRKDSRRYREIRELNNTSPFWAVQQKYTYTKICKSKATFDRSTVEQVFTAYLYSDILFFSSLAHNLSENRTRFEVYTSSFDRILASESSDDKYDKYPFFRFFEKMQCKFIKLHPVTNVAFAISCRYTSPRGRNQYSKSSNYDYNAFLNALNIIAQVEQKKATKKYQRSIMSDSLRYDILKRDGFKCVLCGATVADGVKLHVDHIVPVSRGGKTVKENLRTLCDNCNLGKRDKYDPSGPN